MAKTIHTELRSINKQGKPRVYASDLPVYDTMEITEARTGIPTHAIKLALKKGCDCKRSGKIHVEPFLRFWFGQKPDDEGSDTVDWKDEDRKFAAQLKEIKVEEARERVIEFALVERFLLEITDSGFFGELERLREEFAVSLEGKTKLQIYQEVNRQIDIVVSVIDKRLDAWRKKKGKL
jgi:hypothetical protein